MPWTLIGNQTGEYNVHCRYGINRGSFPYAWVQIDNIGWSYCSYDVSGTVIVYGRGAKSKEAAMKLVDDELIKAGWRLLSDGDKLLTLL